MDALGPPSFRKEVSESECVTLSLVYDEIHSLHRLQIQIPCAE